jgi:hypothetical protein
MPRIKERGDDPINKACAALMRLASRVYKNDLQKSNGCRAAINAAERLIMHGEYDEANYNPYQELANVLKRDFPEVWNGDRDYSGKRALAPWGVS